MQTKPKIREKLLKLLLEKPHFIKDLVEKYNFSLSGIYQQIRTLQLDYNIIKFVVRGTTPSRGREKGFPLNFPRSILYFEKDKLLAYEMVMKRFEEYIYDHWIKIGQPMLGGLVTSNGKRKQIIKKIDG